MLWIVQQNAFGEAETIRFNKAVEECGHTLIPITVEKIDPDELNKLFFNIASLDYGSNKCIVIRGSIQLLKFLSKSKIGGSYLQSKAAPLYYCDWRQLKCSHYYPRFEPNLLNEDYFLLPFSSTGWLSHCIFNAFGDRYFIKPDSGAKPFPAMTISRKHEKEDRTHLINQIDKYALYELCLLSSAKEIGPEYRFVIVEGKVVTGSEYQPEQQEIHGSHEAWQFANYVADRVYHDESEDSEFRKAYTLDVCDNAGYRVVEVNSFSCAGLYEANASEVVKAVSKLAEKEFADIFGD